MKRQNDHRIIEAVARRLEGHPQPTNGEVFAAVTKAQREVFSPRGISGASSLDH
jgi:hypothetical protein